MAGKIGTPDGVYRAEEGGVALDALKAGHDGEFVGDGDVEAVVAGYYAVNPIFEGVFRNGDCVVSDIIAHVAGYECVHFGAVRLGDILAYYS